MKKRLLGIGLLITMLSITTLQVFAEPTDTLEEIQDGEALNSEEYEPYIVDTEESVDNGGEPYNEEAANYEWDDWNDLKPDTSTIPAFARVCLKTKYCII